MLKKRLSIAVFAVAICVGSLVAVVAATLHSPDSGGAIDPTCNTSNPCIQYTNNGSGPGVEGLGSTGNGLFGVTKFNSTSAANGKFGIFGDDLSTSGAFDGGVRGLSVRGMGVLGNSTSGVGVSAASTSFVGANVTGGAKLSGPTLYPALSVVGNGNFDLIDACAAGTNPCHTSSTLSPAVFRVTSSGDIQISGFIFTGGSCSSGCIPTQATSGRRVRFYSPRESLPTVEDFGEAQLVNGRAYVRIDPAFANTIDPRADYLVFITPEGDSRGLFLAAKSLNGFLVRENEHGRSSLAFSYRIIAKPFGDHSARLQMFTTGK